MPVEEFKRYIHSDVKAFLDEKEKETLDSAARVADNNVLDSFFYFYNIYKGIHN